MQRTLPNTKTKLQQWTNATPSTCSTATTVHKATATKLPKKVKTRLTEHENAIKRHDPRSIPANHVDEQRHSFDISNTKILRHTKSRHARKFLEAWHSIQSSTINRHIDIPETYFQLKRLYPGECCYQPLNTKDPTNKRNELATPQPIRRSQRLLAQMLAGKSSHSLLTTARWIELKAQDQNRKSGERSSRNRIICLDYAFLTHIYIYIYIYIYIVNINHAYIYIKLTSGVFRIMFYSLLFEIDG